MPNVWSSPDAESVMNVHEAADAGSYGTAHLRLPLESASAIPGSGLGTVPSSFRRGASL